MPENAFDYDVFISYSDENATWVEGYLLDAFEAADIRYIEETAFKLGVPRLLEFERAIKTSKYTLLVLSPSYLAENFTQFVDVLVQSYGIESATWPVIPFLLEPCEIPQRLAMLEKLDASSSEKWDAALTRLFDTLQKPLPAPSPVPECPYPGMVPFSERDANRFFGRETQVEEVIQRLRTDRFLTVIGPSGSGKSSMIYAGVLPSLRKSRLFGRGEWLVRTMRPGAAPLDALSYALEGDPMQATTVSTLLDKTLNTTRLLLLIDQFEEVFTNAREQADEFQEQILALLKQSNIYVVVTARADFYADLMSTPLWRQIRTHRLELPPLDEDDLRRAIVNPADAEGVYIETALVERLLADAAGEPGVLPFVQETLVLLWEKVERRLLPMGAYQALVLTRSQYGGPRQSGLHIAIARRADSALNFLSDAERAIARRIFLRLVQFGEGRADTRRQLPVSALKFAQDNSETFESVLEHLTNNRLLTASSGQDDERRVDISHEALIIGWPMLQAWLEEHREAETTRRRLENTAQEWVRLGRGDGGLLDEYQLMEAKHWFNSPSAQETGYTPDLDALLQSSQARLDAQEAEKEAIRTRELEQAKALAEEQQKRAQEQAQAASKLRKRAVYITGALIAAVILAIVAVFSGIQAANNAERANIASTQAIESANLAEAAQAEAEQQRDEAIRQTSLAVSRDLAAQAQANLDTDPELSALLAIESIKISDTDEAWSMLSRTEQSLQLLDTFTTDAETGYAEVVAYSPDGRYIAYGGEKLGLVVLDANTLEVVQSFPQETPVFCMDFHPNGSAIAVGDGVGQIVIWDLSTGDSRLTIPPDFDTDVSDVEFSPDGEVLAAASDGIVFLYDAETGVQRTTIEPESGIFRMSFHPEEGTLAVGDYDGGVSLWTIEGEKILDFGTHENLVHALAYSPDGVFLVSGSVDETAKLWIHEEGALLGTLVNGHKDWIVSVSFSPDSQSVVTASTDGTVKVWDVDTRQEKAALLGHTLTVVAVDFHPDTNEVVSSSKDGMIKKWSSVSDGVLVGHLDYVTSIALSPDDETLFSGSRDTTFIVWDLVDYPTIAERLEYDGWVNDVALSDGWVALSSGITVILLDIGSGEILIEKSLENEVSDIAAHPDGDLFAVAGYSTIVSVWDANTGELIAELEHPSGVNDIQFSPDGQTLAAVTDDRVFWWDYETQTPREIFETEGLAQSVAFSPDGNRLVTSEGIKVVVWDLESGTRAQTLEGHLFPVQQAIFSPDGSRIASGGDDKIVIVWDVATGAPQLELSGHLQKITDLAFTSDGTRLYSSSFDFTIRSYIVDKDLLLETVQDKLTRGLRTEECVLYLQTSTCPSE